MKNNEYNKLEMAVDLLKITAGFLLVGTMAYICIAMKNVD